MRPIALLAIALAACVPDSGGWVAVTLESLEGTPNYEFRTRGSGGDSAGVLPVGDGLGVTGDFDGDGRGDSAQLVKNQAAGLYAVRVRLAAGQERIVAEGPLERLPSMGVRRREPGRRLTACGKGYGDCAPDAAPDILLENDGFDLFAYESAGRTFWWRDGDLHSEWTSD